MWCKFVTSLVIQPFFVALGNCTYVRMYCARLLILCKNDTLMQPHHTYCCRVTACSGLTMGPCSQLSTTSLTTTWCLPMACLRDCFTLSPHQAALLQGRALRWVRVRMYMHKVPKGGGEGGGGAGSVKSRFWSHRSSPFQLSWMYEHLPCTPLIPYLCVSPLHIRTYATPLPSVHKYSFPFSPLLTKFFSLFLTPPPSFLQFLLHSNSLLSFPSFLYPFHSSFLLSCHTCSSLHLLSPLSSTHTS